MAVAKTDEFNNYINGEWSKSASGRTFDNVNPADTGDIVGRFQASTADDAQAAVAAAAAAFDAWKKTPISKRAKILNGAADYLEANVGQIAEELTREEGKALNLSKDEVLRSAQTLRKSRRRRYTMQGGRRLSSRWQAWRTPKGSTMR